MLFVSAQEKNMHDAHVIEQKKNAPCPIDYGMRFLLSYFDSDFLVRDLSRCFCDGTECPGDLAVFPDDHAHVSFGNVKRKHCARILFLLRYGDGIRLVNNRACHIGEQLVYVNVTIFRADVIHAHFSIAPLFTRSALTVSVG